MTEMTHHSAEAPPLQALPQPRLVFTTDPFILEHDGQIYEIRHDGSGQFSIYRNGEHVDMFDAADTLRDMACDALEDDV